MVDETIQIIIVLKDLSVLIVRYILKFYAVPNKKKNNSLVRNIGSKLPLKNANRIFINRPIPPIIPNDVENKTSPNHRHIEKENIVQKPHINCCEKIEQLEFEMKKLKEQVLQIISNQITTLPEKKEMNTQHLAVDKDQLCVTGPALKAPPPPPPLPELTFSSKTNISYNKTNKKLTSSPKREKNTLNDVLKELKDSRPTLRHVKLSPGGRPIRPPKVPTDPSEILANFLKQRFDSINCTDSTKNLLNNSTSDNSFLSP
uniref:Uncharacterized protein n=1 Tax=Clastoptera arizonana TaxID=38151 RepID=A0A1B6D8Q9_9HEMI